MDCSCFYFMRQFLTLSHGDNAVDGSIDLAKRLHQRPTRGALDDHRAVTARLAADELSRAQRLSKRGCHALTAHHIVGALRRGIAQLLRLAVHPMLRSCAVIRMGCNIGHIRNHGTGGGQLACAATVEHSLSQHIGIGQDTVIDVADVRERDGIRNRAGGNPQLRLAALVLGGMADQLDGTVELSCQLDVLDLDGTQAQ